MEHGIVTSVTYENGVVTCNVRALRIGTEYRDVPVIKPAAGFVQLPEQGMKVAMDTLSDGTRFITHVIGRAVASPDTMREGEVALQLDDETQIRFEERNDGGYDLHLSASGDVYVDGVNVANHTHEYDDATVSDTEDGSGSSSTETKETSPPGGA